MTRTESRTAQTAAGGPTDLQQALKPGHVEAVVSAAIESHAAATRRSYESGWRQFAAWCDAEGYTSLPAAPETVAAYLVHRAHEGRSIATIKIDRAAIRHYHLTHGLDSPTQSAGVSRVLRGLARRAAAGKLVQGRGQAKGLSASDLAAVRAVAHQRRCFRGGARESEKAARRRGDVDIALISVMRDALLRRQEAAALRWADVRFMDDDTARIAIRHSKTDQDGEGAVQFVGHEAAAALNDIRGDAAEADRVFGLKSGRAISNRIKAAARAAGLKGDFRGHSPRVGMAQDLAANGASSVELMVAGRWKAARMPAHYAREQEAGRGAVARYHRAR